MRDQQQLTAPSGRRRVLAAAIALAIAAGPGCARQPFPGFARVDHLHNNTNQKSSADALDDFEVFTGQTAGLTTTLGKNIEARKALQTTVLQAQSRVDDSARAYITTDIKWYQLRANLYNDLGLLQTDDERAVLTDFGKFEEYRVRRGTLDNRLAEAIHTRQLKIAAVVDVLTLLADAQNALVEQANADAEQAQADLEEARKAAEDAAKTVDAPPAPPAEDPDKKLTREDKRKQRDELRKKRVDWLQKVTNTFILAGQQLRENEDLRATGTARQLKLLKAAEASRDPASAYALVAVVGTGLDAESFRLLDAYLQFLQERLDQLSLPDGEELTPSLPNKLTDKAPSSSLPAARDDLAWNGLNLSMARVKLSVDVAYHLVTAEENGAPTARRATTRPLRARASNRAAIDKPADDRIKALGKLVRTYGGSAKILSDAYRPSGAAQPGPAGRTKAGPSDTRLLPFSAMRPAPASTPRMLSPESAASGNAAKLNTVVDPLGVQEHLRDAADRLDAARSRNNTAAKHLRVTVTATPRRAPSAGTPPNAGRAALTAAVAAKRAKAGAGSYAPPGADVESAPAAAPTPGAPAPEAALSPAALQGFQLLQRTFAANPKLVVSLADAVVSDLPTEKIPQPLLEKIGSIANDVASEVAEAKARIRQFLADLAQVQLDLNEENVRHSQAMYAVGAFEARRWSLLGELNDQYARVFAETSTDENQKFDDPNAVPLFRYGSTTSWLDRVKDRAGKEPYALAGGDLAALKVEPDSLRNHPQVFLQEGVFTSIRKLAETTRAWQSAPQRTQDPTGWNIAASNVRLHKAVATVDGHLLMLSLNENLAADNVVRLDSEIAEHDMQIDGISARAREAGYRLGMGDLKAYHASGITEDDIRVIETALLAWIGVGVQ